MTPYRAEKYIGHTARPLSLRDACMANHGGAPCVHRVRPSVPANSDTQRVGLWEVAEILGGVLIFGSLLIGIPLLLWLIAGGVRP
jgi:hypothetical protein